MKFLGTAFLVFFFSIAAFAQEAEVWDLQKCIEYGVQNNLDVKQQTLNYENTSIDYKQSNFSRYPSLNAGTGYSFSWGRSIDPTSNDFIAVESQFMNAGLNSSVTLFNGFRINNSVKQSRTALEAAQYDLEASRDEITLNIVATYMNVIFNMELYENARAQLNSTRQQAERTRVQVEAGALPKSNLLNIQAQEATNELNMINQENALTLSMLQLKQYLQLPANYPMEISVPEMGVEEIQMSSISQEEVYNQALETLPQMKSMEYNLQSSEYGVAVARGNLYPRLTLSGGIQTNYSSFAGSSYGDQFKDNLNENLSLNLNIPIFNAYNARLNVQRSTVMQKGTEIRAEKTRNLIRQNIEIAYNDVVAASKSFSASEKQVNAREESFRMTQQRYELGAADFTEYQIAENDLFRAKSDLLRAKYDLIYKMKILDYYQGKPLEF